ncbi:MAG: ferrous iron transport protein B [Syntrophales bacterium]|nr:ferrous iron transport protein B [Syntrophales bacterium]
MSEHSGRMDNPFSGKETVLPLFALKENEEAIVRELKGGHGVLSRFASLGIAVNSRLRVVRISRGPVVIQIGGTRIALGHGEAAKIFVSPIETPACESLSDKEQSKKRYLVALAGQPNVGKSTVFNILTGLTQHVGNWPGKTVEKKEGIYICGNVELKIVDLPGTYSLTAFTEEERLARGFILKESPDVVVLMANAAALERSLYLLSELFLLDVPVILGVNMIDVAEAQGIRVNVSALEHALGIPVVGMTATKNRGIQELVDRILMLVEGHEDYRPHIPKVAEDHEKVFEEVVNVLSEDLLTGDFGSSHPPIRWLATKLMEGDREIGEEVARRLSPEALNRLNRLFMEHEDALHAVVRGRYDWIETIARSAISRFRIGEVVFTDRLDHFLTRPVFGIPILFLVFASVLYITYSIGGAVQERLLGAFADLGQTVGVYLSSMPVWVRSLIDDGVLKGVGAVVSLLPILIIFFAVMAVLEDVGYMARVAFVMDRFMHVMGLHGKSIMPMCLGLACNVPAVLGSRIVESEREKLITIFLTPFVPCSARLAVLMAIVYAIFPQHPVLVAGCIIMVNGFLLVVTGMAIRILFSKEEVVPFIMELPLYHRPNLRTIGINIWVNTWSFIKRAGTIILSVSVIVWFFSYMPSGKIESSFLAQLGYIFDPVARVVGLDWRALTALLTGIVAKENALATLAILYKVDTEDLTGILPALMSPPSALAFLVMLMLFVPCVATMAALKNEMANNRWFIASLVYSLIAALAGGVIAYHVGMYFF